MNRRKLTLMLIDAAIILLVTAGIAVIFPSISSVYISDSGMFLKVLVLAACLLAIRYVMGVYTSIWRYANVRSYTNLMISDCIGCFLYMLFGRLFPALNPGFAYAAITGMAVMLLTIASRLCYQSLYAYRDRVQELQAIPERNNKINVAIVGAGNVGATLAEELLRNPKAYYHPYCFIDNDKKKVGNSLRGIKILPENDDTVEQLKKMPVQEIIIALSYAEADVKTKLYERYKQTGCKVKLYDFTREFADIDNDKRVIREFKIEDLLFRDPIVLSSESVKTFYRDKVILVTGGGGSIGSELCRQIAKCHPKELILVDIYENNAYEIQQELIRTYGNQLKLTVLIASVRDCDRVDSIFNTYRPDIVFHAAAHKHVPLMENSPMEAIKNNVFGTYNTANAAEKYGVKKFILISTDKAVNPTNVMGASKRLCEMMIQCRKDSETEFAAVRFGNVLGSNGSVIPLFKQQIAAGGPVTLTDKRIIRYFMTIPEAVGLVMETGVLATGGELFVLNMGKPIQIRMLAEKMIRLSGFVPYKDIDIVEVGLRKGEKLYEELLIKTEKLDKTANNMIFIERDSAYSRGEMEQKLSILREAAQRNDVGAVVRAVKETVPTFCDPEKLNCMAELSDEMKMIQGESESVHKDGVCRFDEHLQTICSNDEGGNAVNSISL